MIHLIEVLEERLVMSGGLLGYGATVFTPVGSGVGTDKTIATLANGEFLVGGTSGNNSADSIAYLAKYERGGRLDRSFGENGEVFETFGQFSSFSRILVEQDGSILAAGSTLTGSVLYHFTAQGQLDSGFGENGVASLGNLSSAFVVATSTGLMAAGSYNPDQGEPIAHPGGEVPQDVGIVKLDVNGFPISTFGDDGIEYTGQSMIVGAAGVDSLGRLTVAGTTTRSLIEIPTAIAMRFTAAGDLDTTFGEQGVFEPEGNSPEQDYPKALSMTLDPQDRLVCLGSPEAGELSITRYTADGMLDTHFAKGGVSTMRSILAGIEISPVRIVFSPHGMVLAGGIEKTRKGGQGISGVAFYRLGPNGRPGGEGFVSRMNTDEVNSLSVDGNRMLIFRDMLVQGAVSASGVEVFGK